MTRLAGAAALFVACGVAHDHSDVPAPDAHVARDCPLLMHRDIDILLVQQSTGPTRGANLEARNVVADLIPALRMRVDGTLRMALTTGSLGPSGVPISGCSTGRFHGGVFATTAEAGRTLGPIVTIPDLSVAAAVDEFTDLVLRTGALIDGCGNSLMEAALRGLAPSDFPLSLPPEGGWHGDRENAGFVHEGDLVLLVFVSFDEDCSWSEVVRPGVLPDCPLSEHQCCDHLLYPTSRYVEGFRMLEDRLGIDIVFASLTLVDEADQPLSHWRDIAWTRCDPGTTPLYVNMPYRLLEVTEALAPDSTSQPGCWLDPDAPDNRVDAIVDRVLAAGCD